MASNPEEQQRMRECIDYMQRSKIMPVIKDVFVQLCVEQPDNPISFMREYFQKLERVSSESNRYTYFDICFMHIRIRVVQTETLVSYVYTCRCNITWLSRRQ